MRKTIITHSSLEGNFIALFRGIKIYNHWTKGHINRYKPIDNVTPIKLILSAVGIPFVSGNDAPRKGFSGEFIQMNKTNGWYRLQCEHTYYNKRYVTMSNFFNGKKIGQEVTTTKKISKSNK